MKRVLVTGGSGLLGANLLIDWSNRFSLCSVQLKHELKFGFCEQALIDLADKAKAIQFLKKTRPNAVVHTAALTSVDYCETHADEAFKANAIATGNVAEAAELVGAKMVYISTDSVFDGAKGNYDEKAKTNPLNVYARTKLGGEKAALEKSSNCIVVRTSIFGWNMQNKESFSEWIYNSLRKGTALRLFKEVYFTPILVNNLGRALAELIENDFSGIINIAGKQRLSKLEFGEILAEAFGFDKRNIAAGSVNEAGLVAKRPLDASLDTSKAGKILETKLLDARAGLEEKKRLLDSGFVEKLKEGL